MPRATLSDDSPRRKLSSGLGGRLGFGWVLGLGILSAAAAGSARGCGGFGNKVDGMSSDELVFGGPPPVAEKDAEKDGAC